MFNTTNADAKSDSSQSIITTIIKTSLEATVSVLILGGISYYAYKKYENQQNIGKFATSRDIAKRLQRSDIEQIEFTAYESKIAMEAVTSVEDMNVTFADIGGLTEQLSEIRDNIVLPFQIWRQFGSIKGGSSLLPFPTGVLLFGKPGTGPNMDPHSCLTRSDYVYIYIYNYFCFTNKANL